MRMVRALVFASAARCAAALAPAARRPLSRRYATTAADAPAAATTAVDAPAAAESPFEIMREDLKLMKLRIRELVERTLDGGEGSGDGGGRSSHPLLQEAAREFFERRERACGAARTAENAEGARRSPDAPSKRRRGRGTAAAGAGRGAAAAGAGLPGSRRRRGAVVEPAAPPRRDRPRHGRASTYRGTSLDGVDGTSIFDGVGGNVVGRSAFPGSGPRSFCSSRARSSGRTPASLCPRSSACWRKSSR